MIIKIAITGIIATILAIVIKKEKPEFSILISLAAGVLIFAMLYNDIKAVLVTVNTAIAQSGIPKEYISILIKVMGVAYVVEFAASIAKDAGESSIAEKIQFAGKITIVVIITPLFLTLFNMITGLLP